MGSALAPGAGSRTGGHGGGRRQALGADAFRVESIEVVDDTHFKAVAKVGVGFISARFKVDMTFVDVQAPDSATIKAHGQAPGSAVDGDAVMVAPPVVVAAANDVR